MAAPQPSIGDWYRQKEGGALFEVVAYDDDDGTIEMAVPPELRTARCLTDAQVDQLHDLATRCQRVWGEGLDLEWAFDADGRLYLLQCRPITTIG